MADAASARPSVEVAGPNSAGSDDASLISLPKFIQRQPAGLVVLLPALESPEQFRSFIDRTFNAGMFFTGLDYAALRRLHYEMEAADIAKLAQALQKAGRMPVIRLADDVAVFPAERLQLYRDPKLVDSGRAAEYMFEPVMVERTVEEHIYGEPDADGNAPVVDRLLRPVTVREHLDADEFVAAMWQKGIRFGIDIAAVQKGVSTDRAERVTIAVMLPPSPGVDASIAEMTRSLHRDDAPRLLADGRIDLHQFQNRFPQVAKNTRLLRKLPRQSGKSGWDLGGKELSADLPCDIDIAKVSGIGTRIDRTAEGEFVVADMSGFLQIDAASGTISISEKIVNHEGVGLHTTGNLTLDGDDYEEHGEVQELSKIEGRNMTFQANVFGKIVSHGGQVVFKKSLNGGSIRNPAGTVLVEGNASSAVLEAVDGEVTLGRAEGCLVIGKKVRIEHAIRCDVLAEELWVEVADGCALAARRLHVGTASEHRDAETTVSILIPDLSAHEQQLEELAQRRAEYENAIEAGTREMEAITTQPEVKSYSLLQARIRANELQLTEAQAANWQRLVAHVTPVLRRLKALNEEVQAMRAASSEAAARIERLREECQALSAESACRVEFVTGDTIIRTLKFSIDGPPLHALSPRDLRLRLRESGTGCQLLFNGSDGEFEWPGETSA